MTISNMSAILGGGSGFVGRHLAELLNENGLRTILVSRQRGLQQITWEDLAHEGLPKDCTAVVNMAGENMLNFKKRWTPEFKTLVRNSRLFTTQALARAAALATKPPKVFISLSGVSYYPPSHTAEYSEYDICEPYDFMSQLNHDWEGCTKPAVAAGVRTVIIRSGVVLGRDGGLIKNIYYPFFMGFGGRIGSGSQWFPWIHVDDLAGLISHVIDNDDAHGVFNGVSPHSVTNSEFTNTLAKVMCRPAILPVPGPVMTALLGDDRARIILEGQKVWPKRTLEMGYQYLYPDMKSACEECNHLFLF